MTTPAVSAQPELRPGLQGKATRGFWALIATQFQGAFSDNVLKNLAIYFVLSLGVAEATRNRYSTLINALFSIPFILFSMSGGYLADRYSKRSVTIATKGMEIGVMLVALAGLWLGNVYVLLAAVFLLSTQAALFGPSKYGLLPELLPTEKLSWGNGIIELGTFLAILTGSIAGAFFSDAFHDKAWLSGAILLALSLAGLSTSFGIARVPAAAPGRRFRVNFLADLWEKIQLIRQDNVLTLCVAGNTFFFFIAALLTNNVYFFGHDYLHLRDTENGLLLAAVAVGIGVGSLIAGFVSGHKIEYGLVPLGTIGMSIFAMLLAYFGHDLRSAMLLLGMLGFFAGFFAVPINAAIQHRPPEDRKGGVIAAANLLSVVGVALAAGVYFVLQTTAGLPPRAIFFAAGVIIVAATVYALWLLPAALLRLGLWFATRTVYKIRVEGRQNIPERGGALLVSNHLSFVDALLLVASTDRFVRFLIFQDIYNHPLIKPWARIMRAIPISSTQRPREMIRSLREATDAIERGQVVCIFAEGQITRIGGLLPFRRGFERIMKGVTAPIVPVHLDGVWGSIFSFEAGRFLWKWPRRIPYPVTVSFGRPMPPESTAFEVRRAVQELHTEAWPRQRKEKMLPLHRAFTHVARHHPLRFMMADWKTEKLRFGGALVKTVFLARRLRKVWAGQEMVGVLMPPSVGGALVNYAALILGKVPVNLNYTASDEAVASSARQCNLTTVLTSQQFLEKVKITVQGKTILIEDLAADAGLLERLTAFLMAWLLPMPLLERALGRSAAPNIDDLATIIFSSGSTGDPKGVMLSHFNIGSNIEQVGQTFALQGGDKVLGILPFFHSFGYTVGLWMPAVLGIGVVYHPNPLDARVIGGLVAKYHVTFMVATPTFLQAYIRRIPPEDLGSLQFVIVGAEKLPQRLADAFEDTFGIRPLEGYGCTECSPVVAVNTRDYRAPGFRQVGAKRGGIGHPLPGMSVRVLDVGSGEPQPIGTPGMLLVRGPNVMQGYLGRAEKTAEVLRDGWYTTGDIAALDEDGFLTITDRLSRFSKIGGEMVPHLKVEEKLHELAEATEQIFAVTSLPDEKKGERLMVLHTLPEEKLEPVLEKFAASDLPALWKPRAQQFVHVDAIPYLGTGKLDLRRIRDLAAQLSTAPDATAAPA
ncbi:MAG: MFS transporter [Candidatus Koribacter versatilis]|uniref:MFS transporter n=1 Tax=Candidatus Korobacter versatilis TaxID=658062 RepID=A0A932A714_9BACT|nr:MFS transporter [Candidatus Koribacter versatilis]